MRPDDRLIELGIRLPELPELPFMPRLRPLLVHDGLAYLSGTGPIGTTGRLGAELTVEEGYAAARETALVMCSTIVDALGTLDAVDRWIKVLGFVRCAPDFVDTPAVINGFTETICELWGDERGLCARSAIGVAELPSGIPVEVEAIVKLA